MGVLAVLEVGCSRRVGFRVPGAIEREEFRQIAVGEVVIAGGLVLGKREVVENGPKIAAALGLVAIVIAERGEKRNASNQRLVGRIKLGRPIGIIGSGM